jgi:hypothetical protein
MNCANLFDTSVSKEDSVLYKDLQKKYKQKADYIYDTVIKGEGFSKDSFPNWLSGRDFEKTHQGEPVIDEYLAWRKHILNRVETQKTFITNKIELTANEFTSIAQGMTGFFPEVLAEKKGMSFVDIQDGTAQLSNITNNIFKKMTNFLEKTILEDIDKYGETSFSGRAMDILSEIRNNEEFFIEAYNIHLKSTMNLTFDSIEDGESMLNESLEEVEEKATKDTAFNKSANEFSSIDNAPKAIKMMIASLKVPGEVNQLGFPKLVDYHKTFNMIHQTLAKYPGDIDLYTLLLQQKEAAFPHMAQLIDQLNFGKKVFAYDTNPEIAVKEQRLRSLFVNQFDKTEYEYTLDVKEDGVWKIINENLDKASNVKLAEWEANFGLLKLKGLPYTAEQIRKLSKAAFLKAIGIDVKNYAVFPDEIVEEIQKRGIPNLEELKSIYSRKTGKFDVRARLLKLASHYVLNDPNTIELQHYNINNKLVYGISLNTYLSNKVKRINSLSDNKKALLEEFPEFESDPYTASSTLVSYIIEGEKLVIEIASGMKNSDSGNSSETSDLNRKDLTIQRIYHTLQEGKYHFLRAADRKIENVFSIEGRTNKRGLFANIDFDEKNFANAKLYLLSHLRAELDANELYPLSGIKNLYLSPNATRVFTLKDGTNLLSTKDLSQMTIEQLKDNPTVDKFLDKKINEIIETEKEYISKQKIQKSDVESLTKLYGSFENVVANYAINAYIGNIEITKLFTGDPLLYGKPANFFKRMSMLNSTKEATRTDNEINEFLGTLESNLEKKYGYSRDMSSPVIKTITLQDIISDINDFSEEEVSLIKDQLGDTKLYSEINEADGFALITYDEYRIMKIRYSEWEPIDEEIYQKVTSGKDFIIEEKYLNRIIPDKSQYVGKLELPLVNVIGGRKFAFMPLIPGLFKEGSVLDNLNREMLSNGVGMAFFESAAKFGHKADAKGKPLHSLNELKITSESVDEIHYKDIGNQLKIRKELKNEETESTQKRKLNLSNYYENGVLKDPSAKTIIDEYQEIQKEKIRRAYAKLKNKLGFNEKNRDQRVKTFIESISSMAKLQGFTSNELLALKLLIEEDIPYLDALPNKARVEQFIMAKMRNGVIRQKRHGVSLAQMSNTGFEMPGGVSRHDLKFYRYARDKNGKIDKSRMLPMEVYSPLPKSLMDYVSVTYNNGKGVTKAALDAFNERIAEDNKRYEQTGVETNLTKMTLFVGFRIPNSESSSSDVGKVKAFYPPYMGSMVIVPKALVVKTGSDFDIDKLNTYTPVILPSSKEAFKFTNAIFKDNPGPIIRALKAEGIGENYAEQDIETLKKWFVEGILQVEPESLINDRNREIYNRQYKEILGSLKKSIETDYITPKGEISKLSDAQLQNKALENEIALTLHPSNWKQLLTPLGTENIKSIVEEIRELRGDEVEENWSDIFLPSKNIDKMIEFLSGKAGVGQVAVHSTNHILSQIAGLKMRALHDYFGVSKLNQPIIIEETVEPVLSELVNKPTINFNFLTKEELLNFEDGTSRFLKQQELEKRAKQLEEQIKCIWKS